MQKVLLAIDGIKPTRTVFDYAVQLCQRLRAELNVLQVIRPSRCRSYLEKLTQSAGKAKRYMEDTMAAAAFAEAGESEAAKVVMAEARKHLNELLPASERAGVSFHLTTKPGRPGREIIAYVKEHRDVVLTIYDASGEEEASGEPERGSSSVPGRIGRKLSTPLVVVQRR